MKAAAPESASGKTVDVWILPVAALKLSASAISEEEKALLLQDNQITT